MFQDDRIEAFDVPPGSFFHGTRYLDARDILRRGFKVWRRVGGDRVAGGGNLGRGIYVTRDPRVALWFGEAFLRVETTPGTRTLNAAVPPDPKVLRSLVREFGRAILEDPPRKVVPRNKQLTLGELVTLLRYHYRETWERSDRYFELSPKRRRHFERISDFRSLLVRCGAHGFGNPGDDNGIVVFAEDRLIAKELVAIVPDGERSQEALARLTKDEIRRKFLAGGSVGAPRSGPPSTA